MLSDNEKRKRDFPGKAELFNQRPGHKRSQSLGQFYKELPATQWTKKKVTYPADHRIQ